MAATAEQVTAEPGLDGTGCTQWGWRIPLQPHLRAGLQRGSPGPCVLGRRWVLLERTKCLFEETLHPGHRAILSPQVSPVQGLS